MDLCEIARMAENLTNRHFLERLFTAEEMTYVFSRGAAKAESLAGMYAAKEAVAKALGTGIAFPLTDIVIGHTSAGQPTVTLTGSLADKGGRVLLSVTHDAGVAGACAVWQG